MQRLEITICVMVLTSFLNVTACYSQDADHLPSTEQFMSSLTACAAGSKLNFKSDLIGSVRDIYQGQKSQGSVNLQSEGAFLSLLPEAQRLEGYRLYVECINGIIHKNQSKSDEQKRFLDAMNADTPIERFTSVFGPPISRTSIKDDEGHPILFKGGGLVLSEFDGQDISVQVVQDVHSELIAAGVSSFNKRSAARIPGMNMGMGQTNGSVIEYRTLDDFQYDDLSSCEGRPTVSLSASGPSFFVSSLCYFGRPGSYYYYQFAFDLSEATKCFRPASQPSDGCRPENSTKPVTCLVYFQENQDYQKIGLNVARYAIRHGM